MSTFPERLAQKMGEMRFNNSTLGRALGVTHTTVARWLGGSMPAGDMFQKLADHLCVSAQWLMGSDDAQENVLREESPPYRAGPDYLAEIVKLSHTADLADLLDTMESLSKTAGVTSPAAAAVAQMIPIVRSRIQESSQP